MTSKEHVDSFTEKKQLTTHTITFIKGGIQIATIKDSGSCHWINQKRFLIRLGGKETAVAKNERELARQRGKGGEREHKM